ncbi:lipopolysaccharide biosynthesis protein [Tundrisphaera sp. TA3]|uniref:lipopolysaccharide biosynthesis protein n=1 Tax=Tundrisphaera sp. TA3 TaxID=3435775 RepID=UPI003EB9EF00
MRGRAVASLTRPARAVAPPRAEPRGAVRDSLVVVVGGQVGRGIGTLTALMLRWWLDPARLGVYTGLRLALDNTNRSSLGIGLGAVQEIPILRAQGREAEARHIADVAHTTNTLTCLIYAVGLIAWALLRSRSLAADPLAAEWTWGLVAVAGLALLKRQESFLIAVLRAHQEFALTSRVDVLESLVSAVAVGLGLWFAGFWGLLASVAVILLAKIAYLQASHPLRFRWAWDLPLASRLMVAGLPILANTAAFGAVLGIDRVLILGRVPDGERVAGLYTIAIMGTSWSLDLAGRIVTVLYTYFQSTLGRTRDPAEVARQAMRAAEAQAPLLAAGGAVAYVLAPTVLGALMPRYVEGLPALRPALPGALFLGLAWPARQAMIALGRPYRLALATLVGLAATAGFGIVGADRAGMVGVAWGVSLGYAIVSALTACVAFAPLLGVRAWIGHGARTCRTLVGFTLGTLLVAHWPLNDLGSWAALALRTLALAAWLAPTMWLWGRRHEWGGLLAGGRSRG